MHDLTVPQTRSFELRAKPEGDGRTIDALAVPYDDEIILWENYRERFAPGSITDEGAILRYGHKEPIGKITAGREEARGRHITAVISDTERGKEVATLIRDGVLTKISIGFEPIEYLEEERDDGTTLITWTKVRAREYSVVEFPAYDNTSIDNIRSTTPSKNHRKDTEEVDTKIINELNTRLDNDLGELRRELGLVRNEITGLSRQSDNGIPFAFRSIGEYAHALVGKLGAEKKDMATRAYEGAVLGDTIVRPTWLGVLEKRMALKQPITRMFTHRTDLPATGMTIEYGRRKGTSTVQVGKQENEGDALVSGKPAGYKVESANVETYGGVGELSIQGIERATVSLLDDLLYDQALEYGRQIELVTRALFEKTVKENEANPVATLPSLTVDELIKAVLAMNAAYDDTAYVLDGLAVSPEVFQILATLKENSKALQFTGAPDDKQGTLTIATTSANFAGLPVISVPKWSGLHATGFSREAIVISESPGAPLRLQDSNIVDLTKTFAVYGYAAHYAPHPELIKPLKIGA